MFFVCYMNRKMIECLIWDKFYISYFEFRDFKSNTSELPFANSQEGLPASLEVSTTTLP